MPRGVRATAEGLEVGPQRVLFVEGHHQSGFDAYALRFLLDPLGVEVRAVGGRDNVLGAARALSRGDPERGVLGLDAYGVVDRDYTPDDEVEARWVGGPFADSRRDLVWRRHEFENYFLEPNFIAQWNELRGVQTDTEAMWRRLLAGASQRAFLDAANLVIKELRSHTQYSDPRLKEFKMEEGGFGDPQDAERVLLEGRDYARVLDDTSSILHADWLRERFHANLAVLFGGGDYAQLRRGEGDWMSRMEGSKLIGEAVSSRFLKLRGANGKFLRGRQLWKRVGRDLMQRFDELDVKPQDLVELRDYFERTRPPRFPAA